MAESHFDAATAVRPRSDGRSFDVDLDAAWTIGPDKPNGGYLLAILGRAALAAVASAGGTQPHVVAANVSYVSSPSVGPATAEVDVLRVGRTASQARARLVQGGAVTVDAMFTLGRLAEGSSPWWGDVPPVELVDEDQAPARSMPARDPDAGPSIRDRVSIRFDPSVGLFATGRSSGSGVLKGWMRFVDGREPDPLSLLFAVDGFPPATFELVATGWVPTLNLTVSVRPVPAPGPLRLHFRVGVVQDGFADEVMEVWDAAGRLVAQSSQLTALRIPADTPRPGARGDSRPPS